MAAPEVGWRILDLLRLHPDTTHIPVILCATDIGIIHAKSERLRNLRCEVLEKPFELAELLDKVQAMIVPPPGGRGEASSV